MQQPLVNAQVNSAFCALSLVTLTRDNEETVARTLVNFAQGEATVAYRDPVLSIYQKTNSFWELAIHLSGSC